jgi:DNA-binding response OmpR family regulator
MRILIVEDDKIIAENIKEILTAQKNVAEVVHTANDALEKIEVEEYEAIILDWMLPDMDGPELIKLLRQKKIKTPILFLTAKSQIDDKVEGLNSGADDYLTKPFSAKELGARVNALVRRGLGNLETPIRLNDIVIDVNAKTVEKQGTAIELSPKEYSILEYLALNKGKAVDRTKLLFQVWGEDADPFSNTIDVHIRYIRIKLRDTQGTIIKTVRNVGYMACEN